MKKKVLVLVAVAAMTITGALVVQTNINEAKAKGNPECPNGCYDGGNGCVCNGFHMYYKEAGNKTGFEQFMQH